MADSPQFTARHYALIADVIKEHDIEPANAVDFKAASWQAAMRFKITATLVELFHEDNERFNEKLFLKACGITPEQLEKYSTYTIDGKAK